MQDKCIHYRKGYKYQLSEDYHLYVPTIKPSHDIETQFILLSMNGHGTIKSGYSWDGASGPTIDTSTNMRASVEHDAFSQLARQGILPPEWVIRFDQRFREVCLIDKMCAFRAWYYYHMLQLAGGFYCDPHNKRETFSAPD